MPRPASQRCSAGVGIVRHHEVPPGQRGLDVNLRASGGHGGQGEAHLHYAREDQPSVDWLGRTCAAALAHIAVSTPRVALSQCAARGCENFFVDDSRNRSRRYCGNACASRTTVAAHRDRARSKA